MIHASLYVGVPYIVFNSHATEDEVLRAFKLAQPTRVFVSPKLHLMAVRAAHASNALLSSSIYLTTSLASEEVSTSAEVASIDSLAERVKAIPDVLMNNVQKNALAVRSSLIVGYASVNQSHSCTVLDIFQRNWRSS